MENSTKVLQLPLDKMSTSTLAEESWQPGRSPGINRMHILWVWLLITSPGRSEALFGPQEVSGRQGGSLTVQCHYEEEYTHSTKYWCHGRTCLCTVVVSTRHSHGRFSIHDNHATHMFTVEMHRLREEDAGIYQCGISTRGFDPMFQVRVLVLQDSTTMRPTSTTRVNNSSSSGLFIVIVPHKEDTTPMASSSEKTILLYLLPTVGVLLLLLLLTAIILVRSQRRKKQAIRDTESNNSHVPDTFPETIPVYATVTRDGGSQKYGIENTALHEDDLEGGYEEIQVLPRIPDPVTVYAVVQKPGVSQMDGVQNNTNNEDGYEDRQDMPKIPHTTPIYAVVKKKNRTGKLESDAINTSRQEIDYEEIQKSPPIEPVRSFY
ncbi:CMRF35-like molecule 1 isoform X2 [Pleurodeles waltl]|uniref:CMRF35-like molecule 1 isoform X2 n=1 Tax=Pleurodeles waltl TaxID=8319 RepID=UPI0037096035